MEYRCNKHLWYFHSIGFLLIGIMGGGRLIIEGDTGGIAIGIALFCYSVWLCFTSIIYFGKRIILTPDGCTISFLSVKKFFPWESYKTKRYQKVKLRRVGINEGEHVIIFTPYSRKIDYVFPLLFCLHFSPFKSFCLGFYPHNSEDLVKMFSTNHEDICTLQEWLVDIQNYDK